jgi:hypothetical protein
VQLSSASSALPDHSCQRVGDRGCQRCRWFEVRLHRRRKPDDPGIPYEYKVELIGRSTVPGEVDRFRVETTTSPNAIVDYLAMGEPRNRYIPKVSRKALHEAADIDEDLGAALDDFDTLVTP